MASIKQQALDTLGKYMDSVKPSKRKELLLWLEGFAYHAENNGKGDDKTNKPA